MKKFKYLFKQLLCSHKERGILILEGTLFTTDCKYSNGCIKCGKLFGRIFFSSKPIIQERSEPVYFSFTEICDPKMDKSQFT